MKFLIDVHLPIRLSKFLDSQEGCHAIHVNQILDKWHTSDSDICKYADANNFVVISKDLDFKNSFFVNRTPKKIIRVTLGNLANNELISLFQKYLPFITPLDAKPHFYMELSEEQIMVADQ